MQFVDALRRTEVGTTLRFVWALSEKVLSLGKWANNLVVLRPTDPEFLSGEVLPTLRHQMISADQMLGVAKDILPIKVMMEPNYTVNTGRSSRENIHG